MSDTPTLAEVFSEILTEALESVHTALPGRVESYNSSTQTADVKPMVLDPDGTPLPVLPNVPVAFQRGGGGFLSFPLVSGDFVFVICAEASLDQWRAKAAETAPGDVRRHHLTAAVALPCLYPSARALVSAHATNVVLGVDAGPQIHVTPTTVGLGSAAPVSGVAKAIATDAEVAKLKADITALKVATSTAITALAGKLVPPDLVIGPAFTAATAAIPSAAATVASSVVFSD